MTAVKQSHVIAKRHDPLMGGVRDDNVDRVIATARRSKFAEYFDDTRCVSAAAARLRAGATNAVFETTVRR